MKRILFLIIVSVFGFIFLPSTGQVRVLGLRRRLLITRSVRIRRRIYRIKGFTSLNQGVIRIRGSHLVVDFNGATLLGSWGPRRPDSYTGTAIIVEGGEDITLEHIHIHGFKVAIMARHVRGLVIRNCDLSYNYRQYLNSNRYREDLSDWQSYHHNEQDQWLRYGAGIYLRGCDSLNIHDDTVLDGQCGLMMTDCLDGLIYHNDFSFNSGIGIGLYRSRYNRVMDNLLDWNVRGFSYGVYYRGQDAAAILVYEQSDHNIFAFNSATHSGDGFFLWAGQSTMNSGKGGANDNLVYGNDFSFAPTNGMEATFSRNTLVDNISDGCDYGFWGGYSHHTRVIGNEFRNDRTGIAIEQGQNNSLIFNRFREDPLGIQLWATPSRLHEGDYALHRDVRSRDYRILDNAFEEVPRVFEFRHSRNLDVRNNRASSFSELLNSDSTVSELEFTGNGPYTVLAPYDSLLQSYKPQPIPGIPNFLDRRAHGLGKKYIMMTPWGPYDFRYPMLWRSRRDSGGRIDLDILGPKGQWTLGRLKGINRVSSPEGTVPGRVSVWRDPGDTQEISLDLVYTGDSVISPQGILYPAGKPYGFSYTRYAFPQEWKVKWFAFDSLQDPVKRPAAFSELIRSEPLRENLTQELNYTWWNGLGTGLPKADFATSAVTWVDLPRGVYILGVTAGDLVRVWIDGKRVLNAWDLAKLVHDSDYHHDIFLKLHGRHKIRVEQAQYGGYGMLMLTLQPASRELP